MPMGFEENLEVLTALNGDTLNVKIGDLFDSTFTFYAEAYVDGTYVKLVSSEADSVSVSVPDFQPYKAGLGRFSQRLFA